MGSVKCLVENPWWSGGFLLVSAFRNETQAGEDPALVTTTTVNLFVFAGIREKAKRRGKSLGKAG